MRLGAMHLHFLLCGQGLFGGLRHAAHAILDAAADAAVALADDRDDHADQRHHHQHRHGDLDAHLQHHHQHGDDGEGISHQGLERIGAGLGDLLGIEVQAADHHRRGLGIKMRGRQMQVLFQHLLTQVAHHAAAGAGQRVIADQGGQAAHHEQPEDGQRQDHRHARLRVDEAPVDQRLHQLGEAVAGQGLDHHRDHGGDHEHPIGARIAEQALVDRPDGGMFLAHGRTSGAVAMAMRRKPS